MASASFLSRTILPFTLALAALLWTTPFAASAANSRLLEDSNFLLKSLQQAGYVSVAAEPGQNVMRVKVVLNDTPALLCVDTGAETAVITQSIGKKAGLLDSAVAEEKTVSGAFGENTRKERAIRLDRLTLGPVRARNLPVRIRSGSYGPVDGLLGREALAHFGTIIDFGAGILHLRKSATAAAEIAPILDERGFFRVELTNELHAPVTVKGRTGWVFFDSGAGLSLFDRKMVKELNLPRFDSRDEISDITGETRHLEGARILDFSLGTHRVREAQVGVTDLKDLRRLLEDDGFTPLWGCFGGEFLVANRAILDCQRGHLYLAHKPAASSARRLAK